MGLNRRQLSQIYRPIGPKAVQVGITPSGASAASLGGTVQLTQTFDLSLPIRGLRFTIKGRLVVGTAAFTTPYPEGFLAVLSNITVAHRMAFTWQEAKRLEDAQLRPAQSPKSVSQ